MKSSIAPVDTVFFTDIFCCSPLRNCVFKIIKSVLHNGCVFRYDFKPLFFTNPETERRRAGNNGAVCNLAVKHHVYSFTVYVSFILRNGQLHIDIQTPVCGCRVVLFISGLPVAVVRLQYFHNFVIISNGTKPAVKAGKKQNVYFITFHTVHHALKFSSFVNVLSGGLCGVNINSNNDPATFPCVCFQSFLLGFQRQAFYLLFFAGNPYI